MAADDSLRQAGGPRGVDDRRGRPLVAVVGAGRRAGGGRAQALDRVALAVDREHGQVEVRAELLRERQVVLVGDDRRGAAVAEREA